MLALHNATIDDTVKPAIEWIDGKAVQKLMPTDLHSILQLAFARFLDTWAKTNDGKRGKVGPEWRFITPPNSYDTQSVVPDVAYLAKYFDIPKAERTYPARPPDIAVEILSPDDQMNDVEKKRTFYLRWGVKLVIIVDPVQRTAAVHESPQIVALFSEKDTLRSAVFPSLAIPLPEIFAELDEPDESE